MKNKTKKEIKKLSKAVSEVRKENAKLTRKLEKRIEAVERQAEVNREETAGASHPQAESGQAQDNGHTQEAREVTEAATRKAGELGVDLSEVRGTGSGGRVLVKDVDLAAQERAGGAGS